MAQLEILRGCEDNADISQIIVGVFDYNGVLRGKRMPVDKVSSLLKGGFQMPVSILQTDIWGRDIDDSPLIFEAGDGDSLAQLTGRMPIRLSWMAEPTALLVAAFCAGDEADNGDGYQSHELCAAGRLAHHQKWFHDQGLKLHCGIEMELYLLSAKEDGGQAHIAGDTLSLHHLDDYDGLLHAINQLCRDENIGIESVTSELGVGQIEVTFAHKSDLVEVADDILIFKYMVKGLAKSFGVRASFMAKPVAGEAGSGLHVHASISDESGANIFDDDRSEGSQKLRHAVAGILATMKESALILAPNCNSYRRLVPSSHAPTKICWGMDNRTASIRIPASQASARRLEYRSAGADVNPYLFLSALAGGIAAGLSAKQEPPEPVVGNAYEQAFDDLPCEMGVAMGYFADSAAMKSLLGPLLHRYFLATKRQEWDRFATHISQFEFESLSNNI